MPALLVASEGHAVRSRTPSRIAANTRWALRLVARHSTGDLPGDRAAPRLRARLSRASIEGNPVRAERLARRLIGRGAGLTPSGDDFLVGFLAGLDHPPRGRDERVGVRLRSLVIAERARTTPLSAEQLRCAAAGDFHADLLRARFALVAPQPRRRAREAIVRLLAFGHSSGAAACAGLCAGLSVQHS